MKEPPIGTSVIDIIGHVWTRENDGYWWCYHGEEEMVWTWDEVIDDTQGDLEILNEATPASD